jgi:phosphatidylglycerol:prolipoprotein diacylglycerol transferase
MNTIAFPKLGLEFTVNRFISVFGLDIAWYAILISLGFLLAVIYGIKRMPQFGLDSDRAIDAILAGMVGGLIGARLYYVAFSWDQYKDNLMEIFNTRNGGLAIYGGIIGALAFGLLVCKLRKVKILPMLDITALGFLLGQGIGRWGNFINGEAFGSETDSVFGMTIAGIADSPVHPCFLYESLWCLLGFLLLHFYSKKRKFDGEVALFYLIWYGAERAVVEGLRQDSLYLGNLRVSQVLSVMLVIAALIIWFCVRSKIKRENDPNYLKLYVYTEESKELLRQAQEKNSKKTKKTHEEELEEDALEDGVEEENDEKLQKRLLESEEAEEEADEESEKNRSSLFAEDEESDKDSSQA